MRVPSNHVPVIGQQKQAAQQALAQAVQQMTVDIYTQMAADHIGGRVMGETINVKQLQEMARSAQKAAQAFFEGLGVASFQEPDSAG